MRHRHGNEFPVSMIELIQFCVVRKLGEAPLRVLVDMHLLHMSRVSLVLM